MPLQLPPHVREVKPAHLRVRDATQRKTHITVSHHGKSSPWTEGAGSNIDFSPLIKADVLSKVDFDQHRMQKYATQCNLMLKDMHTLVNGMRRKPRPFVDLASKCQHTAEMIMATHGMPPVAGGTVV